MSFKIQRVCNLTWFFNLLGNHCQPLRACAAARMPVVRIWFESTEKLRHQNRSIIKGVRACNCEGVYSTKMSVPYLQALQRRPCRKEGEWFKHKKPLILSPTVSLQIRNATKNVAQYDNTFGLSGYGQITWDFQTGPNSQRPWMDFARSVAHLSILNPGALAGCTDNTLGGYYRLYQQSGKEVPFVCF